MVLLLYGPHFKDLVWTVNWLEIKYEDSGCDFNALVRRFRNPGGKGKRGVILSNQVTK